MLWRLEIHSDFLTSGLAFFIFHQALQIIKQVLVLGIFFFCGGGVV
jgi:hypothetical protein